MFVVSTSDVEVEIKYISYLKIIFDKLIKLINILLLMKKTQKNAFFEEVN